MSAARSGEAAAHRMRTVRTEKDLVIVFPPSQQVGRGVGRGRTSVRVRNEENDSKRMLARTPISPPPRFAKRGERSLRDFHPERSVDDFETIVHIPPERESVNAPSIIFR